MSWRLHAVQGEAPSDDLGIVVHGANEEMMCIEAKNADIQLAIYEANKKAIKSMGHAYAYV